MISVKPRNYKIIRIFLFHQIPTFLLAEINSEYDQKMENLFELKESLEDDIAIALQER